MERATANRLRTYAAYFGVWTVIGLFFMSQAIAQKFAAGDPTPAWNHATSWLVGVYLWALATPGIVWIGRRYPIERKRWVRRVAMHAGISVFVALAELAIEAKILVLIGVFPNVMKTFIAAFAFLMILGFHQAVATYWVVLGVQAAFGWYRRYQERAQQALRLELHAAELQTQLARAQLGALKMQLQPHFLFNTMNAIMVLVRAKKGELAEEMLARLSDLLRCVLEDVDAQEVSLRRELEYLRLYLSIEEVRFQDRLHVEIAADASILEAAVPQMGLQPLVENAIRHGIGKSSSAGLVRVEAWRANGSLTVRVEDDGPGFPIERPLRQGIGLANTEARLRQLYGERAKLDVANGSRGAVVTMTLPYRAIDEAAATEMGELS